MENSSKKYIFLLTTPLLIWFLGYRYRQVSDSIFLQWSSVHFNFGYSEEDGDGDNSTNLPYHDELPTTERDVHSPLYLIQLAKFERFIYNLLAHVEEVDSSYLHPRLLQKIKT